VRSYLLVPAQTFRIPSPLRAGSRSAAHGAAATRGCHVTPQSRYLSGGAAQRCDSAGRGDGRAAAPPRPPAGGPGRPGTKGLRPASRTKAVAAPGRSLRGRAPKGDGWAVASFHNVTLTGALKQSIRFIRELQLH